MVVQSSGQALTFRYIAPFPFSHLTVKNISSHTQYRMFTNELAILVTNLQTFRLLLLVVLCGIYMSIFLTFEAAWGSFLIQAKSQP